MYTYHGQIVRVIDGDTVVVDIDLGLRTWRRDTHIRLAGINAPEIRGDQREQGLVSKAALEQLLPPGKVVRLQTEKDKTSFDRYVATIWVLTAEGVDKEVNAAMIEGGYAVVSAG